MNRRFLILVLSITLLAISCGQNAPKDGHSTDPISEPGGPRIISFTSNRYKIMAKDTFTLSVIVTDPDGIKDVIGGQLVHVDDEGKEGATYGTFATSAEEGAYSMTLTWDALEDMGPLNSANKRVIRAMFYDQKGNTGRQDLKLEITCKNAGQTVCNGKCFDLQWDSQNCSACGKVVNTPVLSGTLKGRVCQNGRPAAALGTTGKDQSCEKLCGASSLTSTLWSYQRAHDIIRESWVKPFLSSGWEKEFYGFTKGYSGAEHAGTHSSPTDVTGDVITQLYCLCRE